MSAITLISPAPGAATPPLQAYAWTGFTTHPRDPQYIRHPTSGTNTYDRSLPRPVHLAWRDPTAPANPRYRITLSQQPDLTAPTHALTTPTTSLDIWHLPVGATCYWQVDRDGETSGVHTFHTHPALPRWIHVPGMTNVRDLGGWPLRGGGRIRQGLVFRSSEMNGHIDIHPRGRRVLEDELGIRTDLDLRGEGEDVRAILDERRVRWLNVPIRPYGEIIREQHYPGYRRIIELFADPANYPVLLHCWGGADRAGTVAYMLHAILDGFPEHLAQDYELTTMAVWEERLRTNSGYRSLLATLAAFGNGDTSPRAQVEHYLHAIGITPDTLSAIRAILISPSPSYSCA